MLKRTECPHPPEVQFNNAKRRAQCALRRKLSFIELSTDERVIERHSALSAFVMRGDFSLPYLSDAQRDSESHILSSFFYFIYYTP